jgi:hypothetical protein
MSPVAGVFPLSLFLEGLRCCALGQRESPLHRGSSGTKAPKKEKKIFTTSLTARYLRHIATAIS